MKVKKNKNNKFIVEMNQDELDAFYLMLRYAPITDAINKVVETDIIDGRKCFETIQEFASEKVCGWGAIADKNYYGFGSNLKKCIA